MPASPARDLRGRIVELAREEISKARPSGKRASSDYTACARALFAAIKSGSEADMATALEALHEVNRSSSD